jgi:hypothetical protein
MNSFEQLLNQVDAFIRKYYKNQLLRGLILFLVVFLLLFLLVSIFEYFGRFSIITRSILFYGFISLNIAIIYKFIFIPLLKVNSFGKRISRVQASEIIGQFFPDVSDRLKNTLQLQESLEYSEGNVELLRASVLQRSNSLQIIPFTKAVDFKENRQYIKRYLIPAFVIFTLIGFSMPSLLTQGSKRVINYGKEYKVLAPFSFNLLSTNLVIEEGKDLPIEVELKGTELPENVYLISDNGKFLMTRKSKNLFHGLLKRVKNTKAFSFEANEFSSKQFKIDVFGKAAIGKLEAKLMYPAYLGKVDEVVPNAGDLLVPEGTLIEWSVVSKNTKHLDFIVNNQKKRFTQLGFKIMKKMKETTPISLVFSNKFMNKIDSTSFTVDVVKDAFPIINVNEKKDSLSDGLRFFSGHISDDYGLSSLTFVYKITHDGGQTTENKIPVRKVVGNDLPFDFAVDFRREDIKLKDKIEYYFLVGDNDGVNGSKFSKSAVFMYELPALDELNEIRSAQQEKEKENLSELIQKTQDFHKNIEKLKKDAMNSKTNDWNKINKLNQLKEEQKSLVESLEKMKNKMEQSQLEKNQLSEGDKELMDKQDQIDKLLEDLMDDELRTLLDQLEKLMENNSKDELKNKLEDLEKSSEKMKNQLDRSLEMLKKLQVNEKIDDIEKELENLSKEQLKLKEDLENKKLSKEQSLEKQQEINKKFDELKEDVKELRELNQKLADPMSLADTEKAEETIDSEMKEAEENIESAKNKKAKENQQKAADQMKKMAEQLDQSQKEANKQEEEEDINSLRNILESLMTLSFDQENVLVKYGKINDSDPAYRKFGRKQRAIVDDTKIVSDSLMALAKRQPKIARFVDKELAEITKNQRLSLEDIDEHRRREMNIHQQLVMTSFNNLALLLNESLQSMQQSMQSKMDGEGSCSKPGSKGKPKPGGMSSGDMKQMLKKQLDQMQKGPNAGGKKPGEKEGSGMGMLGFGNKEIAKMAAEQTAIRQRLEQLRNEMNKEGKGKGNGLNPLINELEKQEKELINKQFSPELLNRQKDILTRLLESEKALMERGFEEKRESKTGKNDFYGNKIRFDEYNKQKLNQIDLLRSVDPSFKKYYMNKANEYFNTNLE